jgi:hypothetical protein
MGHLVIMDNGKIVRKIFGSKPEEREEWENLNLGGWRMLKRPYVR